MSPEVLLKGTFLALEQCGLLLRDANILYQNGSYASTIVLAAFAHEELGRHRMLLDFWRRARSGKGTFTAVQIKKACDDHVTKQREGMSGTTITSSGIRELSQAMSSNHPSSSEFQDAKENLDTRIKSKQKRTPDDRHAQRESALYVEPVSETEWNRPADKSATVAWEFLREAVGAYALQYHKGFVAPTGAILKVTDPALYSALEQWPDRPTLYPASKLIDDTLPIPESNNAHDEQNGRP